MHHHYNDIRSRIAEEPLWFDERAVPRYEPFKPSDCACIYAQKVALVLISCQSCEREFKVCFSWDQMAGIRGVPDLWEQVKDGSLHYGDPPNINCCPAGPTMNCNDLQVLEAWAHEGKPWERRRFPEYEILLPDHEDYKEPDPCTSK